MKMKDVFDLPVHYKGGFEIFENNPWNETIRISEEILKPERCANAVVHAVNSHDKLTEENARLEEALTGCSNELEYYIKKENAMIRRANDGDDSYSINSHYLAQAKHLLRGDEDE